MNQALTTCSTVATMLSRNSIASISMSHSVRHFFPDVDVAIGEHEAEGIRKKPALDTVFEALRQLGVAHHPSSDHSQTSDIVYIGDSDVDIATARNSGLPCVSLSKSSYIQ